MITTEKELGKALKNDQNKIEIEGDLVKKVIKIRATGKVAWGVCIGSIGVAVTAIIVGTVTAPVSAGTTTFVSNFVAAPAVAIPAAITLGAKVTTSAICIAVSAGGVGALNKLRSYKVLSKNNNRVVLVKK